MHRTLSPFSLTLIVLRFVGAAVLLMWFFEWYPSATTTLENLIRGNISPTYTDWWQSFVPRFLLPHLWRYSPTSTFGNLCMFSIGLYLVLGGKAVAMFFVRGMHTRGCPKCGYSLTGLKIECCPECGTALGGS